jgi:hypothetical protein
VGVTKIHEGIFPHIAIDVADRIIGRLPGILFGSSRYPQQIDAAFCWVGEFHIPV